MVKFTVLSTAILILVHIILFWPSLLIFLVVSYHSLLASFIILFFFFASLHTISFWDLLHCWSFGFTHLFPTSPLLTHLLLFHFGTSKVTVHVMLEAYPIHLYGCSIPFYCVLFFRMTSLYFQYVQML